jgi:hypothetical protein
MVRENLPQGLSGRQSPVPLQFGRNRRPVDGCDTNIDDLIRHKLPPQDINEGFELMRAGERRRLLTLFCK